MIAIDVNVGRCNDATLCDPDDVNMGALSTSINADVSGLGGLVSAGSGGEIAVKYTAGARLKLGVTLDNGLPKVYVLPGTGVAVKGRFQATGLELQCHSGTVLRRRRYERQARLRQRHAGGSGRRRL